MCKECLILSCSDMPIIATYKLFPMNLYGSLWSLQLNVVRQAVQLRDGSESLGAVEQWLVAGVRSSCDGSCEKSRLGALVSVQRTEIFVSLFVFMNHAKYIDISLNILSYQYHSIPIRESINYNSHDMHN